MQRGGGWKEKVLNGNGISPQCSAYNLWLERTFGLHLPATTLPQFWKISFTVSSSAHFHSLSHIRSLSLFSTFTAMQLCHTFGKCLLLISFNLTLPLSTMTPHYIEYNQQSESVRHSKYPKVCPLVCGVRSGDAAEIFFSERERRPYSLFRSNMAVGGKDPN